MTSRSHLTTVSVLLADAASLHTIFLLFAYVQQEPTADPVGLLVWWTCLTGVYALLAWFLRSPRPLWQAAALAAGGMAVQTGATLLPGVRYPSWTCWFFLLLMWAGMYGQCCNVLFNPFRNEQFTSAFERTAAVLLAAALAVSGGALAPAVLAEPAAGLALTLLALARSRSDHARVSDDEHGLERLRDRALLALGVTALGGGAALCALFLTDTGAVVLTRLWTGIKSAGLAVLRAMGRFLYWLFSLFPAPQGDMGELQGPESVELPQMEEMGGQSDAALYVMAAVILALLLVLLIRLFRESGRWRLPALSRRTGAVGRTGKKLREILALLLGRAAAFLRFQYRYLTRRNTAPGLLIWLERKLRLRLAGRKPGETARAFLLRAGEKLPACREDLSALADCLDAHYFGGGQTMSRRDAAAMRRRLAQAMKS